MVEQIPGVNLTDENALNQYILKTEFKAAKVSVPKPIWKKTKIVIIKRNDKTGEPETNPDGTNVLLEGEIDEFFGFKEELVDFPVPDVFNDDRGKAYLLDPEVYFVRVADHSFSYFMQKHIATKNDKYLPLLNLIAVLASSVTTTSSARHGFKMIMAKKKISQSQTDEIAKMQAEEQIKNQGLMGRLWPFGNKQQAK